MSNEISVSPILKDTLIFSHFPSMGLRGKSGGNQIKTFLELPQILFPRNESMPLNFLLL